MSAARLDGGRVEPAAVVADPDDQSVAAEGEHDLHVRRAAVPERVTHGLLQPHQDLAGKGRRHVTLLPAELEMHHALPMRKTPRRVLHKPRQVVRALALLRHRPQRRPQTSLRMIQCVTCLFQLLPRLGRTIRHQVHRRLKPEHRSGEKLLESVVQVAGKTQPLPLHRHRLRPFARLHPKHQYPAKEKDPADQNPQTQRRPERRRADNDEIADPRGKDTWVLNLRPGSGLRVLNRRIDVNARNAHARAEVEVFGRAACKGKWHHRLDDAVAFAQKNLHEGLAAVDVAHRPLHRDDASEPVHNIRVGQRIEQ